MTMRMSPISDLRVRVKMDRETLDELLESLRIISRIADATGDPDLVEVAARMGIALGRVGAEVIESRP